ncbi:MAG: NERD domain-containing protein [Sporolactobacillus sp.]
MFVKPVTVPYHLLQYEACLRRLPPGSAFKTLSLQAKNYRAGFKGEQMLEPLLNDLPRKDYYVFHDLRLSNRFFCFQIDYLILTLSFFLILEVKNIAGICALDFNSHTLKRKLEDHFDSYDDPTIQAAKLRLQFQDWLCLHCPQYASFPIEDRVVFPSPATFIHLENGLAEQQDKIIRGPQLRLRMNSLTDRYSANVHTSLKSIHTLSDKLLTAHQPKRVNLFDTYSISPESIIKGVQCPNCAHLPMTRLRQNWLCPKCGHAAPKAYQSALTDYQLIFGNKITSRQCKDFLQLDSLSTARYLLKSINPKPLGARKNRTFLLS